ncbi:MAG: cytochrome P450 [Chloroflexi bacterium]|nr:cytochrome P450 [Chloroflexota bacterium]
MEINLDTKYVKLDPKNPDFYQNPYPYYAEIREKCPIFYWEDFNIWCFVNHADVDAVLRNRDFGVQIDHLAPREELGLDQIPENVKVFHNNDSHGILGMEPPKHTQIRKLVQKSFMNRQIGGFKTRIEELSHKLIDDIEKQERTNLLESFATPIPITIIAELLGVPIEMGSQMFKWSHDMVRMYHLGKTEADEARAVKATIEFSDYLRMHVAERRSKPKDDLLTQLIEIQEEGERLTEEELIANCILLLNAGHEATVNVIGNGIYALLKNPDQLQILREHPELIDRAVEEILRYDTPLHFFKRWVLKDSQIGDIRFPFKTQVAVLLGAANHDPGVFENPEKLDVMREYNPHLSFGGGIHFCVGAPLARLELQTAIPIILERLPNMQLESEPLFADTYHFRGLESLVVRY